MYGNFVYKVQSFHENLKAQVQKDFGMENKFNKFHLKSKKKTFFVAFLSKPHVLASFQSILCDWYTSSYKFKFFVNVDDFGKKIF
jgi:hypothetical protein